MPAPVQTEPVHIASDCDGAVVFFNASDFDRFVTTQQEAYKATVNEQKRKARAAELSQFIGSTIGKIHGWCKAQPVASCLIAPRMDDLIVIVVASDEDDAGTLHDEMARLDLEIFNANGLRLSWMLLRASEAEGVWSFANQSEARFVYRADR